MSNQKHQAYLIFTIGPVQGFVGQARRTRDLWAGSWLLSHLSETALVAAESAGGESLVPSRQGLEKQRTSRTSAIGGYPNRFTVGFPSTEQASAAGKMAIEAFQKEWQQIAENVWKRYIQAAAQEWGNRTREIWDKQVQNFWELSWVVGDSIEEAGRLSAARKAFRNSPCELEEGFKCSLIGTHQELSGNYRRQDKSKKEQFWNQVHREVGSLDLKDGEYLSAISIIKRLYPRTEFDNQTSWPSTSFIAASSWLTELEGSALEMAKEYVRIAKGHKVDQNETQAAKDSGIPWANIDAQAWFTGGLERNEWGLEEYQIADLQGHLEKLYREAKRKPLPFYSLLVMDGDSLGQLLEELKDPTKLSEGLKQFADGVQETVAKLKGRTVYAGGDDVLAMVAPEKAFEAAEALRTLYQKSFEKTDAKGKATISGALIYTPLHTPLTETVAFGHDTLDKVAKDRTGRDAIAVAIVLGSGLSALWSVPWSVAGTNSKYPGLMEMLPKFGKTDTGSDGLPLFNASYLYKLREQYSKLFPRPIETPGVFETLDFDGSDELLLDLAHAEYRRRLPGRTQEQYSPEETREHLKDLMWLSRRWSRIDGEIKEEPRSFSFDGWRVARFLKQLEEGEVTLRG